MADNVKDTLPRSLMNIQKCIADFRANVEARLDRLEEVSRKQRRDSAGMLVMMRAIAGGFEKRVSDVEQRILALEAGKNQRLRPIMVSNSLMFSRYDSPFPPED